MKLPSVRVPYRLFSTFLWCLLAAFVATNAFVALRKPEIVTSLLTPSLVAPFSANSHITSALALWNQGFQESAKQEIRIADDLFHAHKESVLGIASPPSTLLNDWESKPQQLKNEYAFWEMVAEEKPQYRDGLIMAGLYAYQLGERETSKQYLEKAYDLDPNYEPLNMILEKIGK
jgi:tetratricopeptide (TPR) repeat protein